MAAAETRTPLIKIQIRMGENVLEIWAVGLWDDKAGY